MNDTFEYWHNQALGFVSSFGWKLTLEWDACNGHQFAARLESPVAYSLHAYEASGYGDDVAVLRALVEDAMRGIDRIGSDTDA